MELNKIPQWMLALEPEDAAFLKNFALKSGSLKEIARLYQVSYPTVRLRLDKLIQKIELADQQEEEPFTAFIKGLAVDSRIDVETAEADHRQIREGEKTYMRELAVLFISLALLALEYYLGTRRKPLLGALLPGGILLLLAGLSIAIRDPSGMLPGIPCAAGLAAAWLIGRNKATAAEKAELEKMRAKDL